MSNKTHEDSYDVCSDNCGCPRHDSATMEELLQKCAFLWAVVCRNCKETPVRVTPKQFASFVATLVNVDYSLVQRMIDERFGSLNLSTYATQTQLTNAIAGIDLPPAGISESEVTTIVEDMLAGYVTSSALSNALSDYFTKTQINALLENQQTQITTLSAQVQSLQAQMDACNCDGSDGSGGNGGEEPAVTPASIDAVLVNLTDNVCPQCVTRTVTNPDNLNLGIGVTGDGTVTARVNNIVVSDLSSFVAADGSQLEICLTGDTGQNVVGGISLFYIDNGNSFNIDGLSYDVTCPTTQTNSAPASNGTVADVQQTEGDAFTIAMASCFNDGDGDNLTYAISPQQLPAGFSFNTSTGVIMVSDIAAAGMYSFSVTANDGQETSEPCTVEVEIEAAVTAPIVTLNGNCPAFTTVMEQSQSQLLDFPSPFDNVPSTATWVFTQIGGGAQLQFPVMQGPADFYAITLLPNTPSSLYDFNIEIVDNGQTLATCAVNTVEVTGGIIQ